jgi:tyrosine-protein kinase Etk/Wzc
MEDLREADFLKQEDELNLREILFRYLRYWYFFLITIAISLAGAYIYNRYSDKMYLVSSKILVQDQKKSPAGTEILKELDIFKNAGIVENEIEIIRSRPIISRALDHLNFDVTYILIGDIKESELYDEKIPFRVKYDSLSKEAYLSEFEVHFLTTGKINLSYKGKDIPVKYNEVVKTPVASFMLVPNLKFEQSQFLDKNYVNRNFIFRFNSKDKLIQEFYTNFKVATINKMATVLDLSIQTSVPEKGRDFLDQVTSVYIQNGIDQKNEMASNTFVFIQERLKYVSSDLMGIESEVEQYKISKGIADIGEEAKYFLMGVKDYDKELSIISMEQAYTDEIMKSLLHEDFKPPAFVGPIDPSLEKLVGELYNLQALQIQYKNTIKNDNPLNTILKDQIIAAKENIKENISGLKGSLNIRQEELKKKLAGYEANIKQIPTIERDLVGIERQKSIKENLYLYLLQKQEESAIALASTVSDNKIIEPAYFSEKPIKPITTLIYLVSLVVGLLVPAVFIYIRNLLNNTVISKALIEKIAKAPIIGVVGQSESESSIAIHDKAKSAISEEFRSIRTNLQFMGIGISEKVMLVTSSVSGEGKTFISLNLALTFAISGKRTVVLEMDLRKPKLTRNLENPNPVGISNYLIGLATAEDIISKSTINNNLYIISSGPIPPNPAELLMSEKLNELILVLREQFDIVIIDSPPIGLVTDSLIISEHIDASLYIVRQSHTPKFYLTTIADVYLNKKMKKLSIVFNGIDRKMGNYGYGYGYGYGYYFEDKKEKKPFFESITGIFKNKKRNSK